MKALRVLVAYASRRCATAEIAEWIGDELRREGVLADVRPAADVHFLDGYDAVILGGALNVGLWHGDARRFAFWHRRALRELPVWLFSSGPRGDAAAKHELGPAPGVARIARHLGARAPTTFGGSVESRVREWASAIAEQLSTHERVSVGASEG